MAPSLGMIAVGELAPIWLSRKESDVAPSNYRTLESAWRIHVEPVWGTTRVADVDLAAVERWIATMGKTSGATVVVRAYGVLAGILDDAVKARRLASNPARGVENLPGSRQRHVYLSAEDVGRLAGESGQHRALVLVLAYYRDPVGRSGGAAGARCRVPASQAERPRQRGAARCRPRRRPDEGPQGTARCRCRSSCSMSCRCSARARLWRSRVR